ncbi:MAG: maleylpyruvate isomerase family mycothiol-dependent enzyme [Nocardioides sp.]
MPATTTLPYSAYLDHIGSESARFRSVLATCNPTARVPACPDWDAADLLWHLAEVQWFWSRIVTGRPAGPEDLVDPVRPETHAALLVAFDNSSAALQTALRAADPADEAWTWAPEQTTGFTYRRQAHEALIHRIDAEQAAGDPSPLDAALAADGVHECLAVMYGGCPPWGRFTPGPHHVRFDLTDVGVSLWVSLGRFTGVDPDGSVERDEADLSVVEDPQVEPSAVVSATAAALDTWLWDRSPADGVHVGGDPAALEHLRGILGQAIN